MTNTLVERGFIKRAAEYGISEYQAKTLFKRAFPAPIENMWNQGKEMLGQGAHQVSMFKDQHPDAFGAAAGGLGGAALGGVAGGLMGGGKGALAGAGLGAAGGAGAGMLQQDPHLRHQLLQKLHMEQAPPMGSPSWASTGDAISQGGGERQ